MKTTIQIDLRNPQAFHKGEYDKKKKLNSYFMVEKGEDLEEAMAKLGFSVEEIRDRKIAILKGNPHWLLVEKEDDKKLAKKVEDEKVAHKKRFDELMKLNKQQQVDLLKKLKAEKVPRLEANRVKLIIELEGDMKDDRPIASK